MRFHFIIAVLAIALVAPIGTAEDTLELSDGRVLSGTFIQQRDGLVWFEYRVHGLLQTHTFRESTVVRIDIDPASTLDSKKPEGDTERSEDSTTPEKVVTDTQTADVETDQLVIPRENIQRVRDDFVSLAPFLSMDQQITMEILNAIKVAEKVVRIHSYASASFDSHPILASVGTAHMKYLIESESRVTLVYRAEEVDLESLFLEAFSRLAENEAIRIWQAELEYKCYIGYRRIIPVAAALAASPDREDLGRLQIEDHRGQLSLVNHSDVELTNTTLVVTFKSPTNQQETVFYFVPSWPAGANYELRTPLGWSNRGGPMPMRLSARVLSDQWSTTTTGFELPDGGQRAVKNEFYRIERLISSSPGNAVALLQKLKGQLPAIKEFQTNYRDLYRQARIRLNGQIDALNESLKRQRAKLRDLQKQARSRKASDSTKEYARRKIKSLEANIRQTKDRLAELRRMK